MSGNLWMFSDMLDAEEIGLVDPVAAAKRKTVSSFLLVFSHVF